MKFPAPLEPIVDRIRGKHKSIRYRFWQLPKEKLTLRAYKLRGKSWIDYYRDRMDGMTAGHQDKRPAQVYLNRGQDFLDYMVRHGLKPEHKVFDFGCGVLRAAIYLVPYLDPGNYVGTEISKARLNKGLRLMDELGIPRERYTTHVVNDCELRELGDRKFDYVWASSVLTHMPESDIHVLLKALKKHLAPGAVFFFTFSPSERLGLDHPVQEKIKDFYYPTAYLQKIFEGHGYEFTVMPDGHAQSQKSPTVRVRLR